MGAVTSVGTNAQEATNFLKQVAEQSYGSKLVERSSGGRGSIGMIDGKPVKFNTHRQERVGKATPEMIKSSNELRESLGAAAKALSGEGQDGKLKAILDKLGLDAEGHAVSNKDLLSRKVAAQVLHQIDDMRNEGVAKKDRVSSFKGVEAMRSKGVNTSFTARQFGVAAQKLGIELDAKQVKALQTLLPGNGACFQGAEHASKCQKMLDFFCGAKLAVNDSDVKDAVAFLQQLPVAKRADGLFMALSVGAGKTVVAGLNSEAILDEIVDKAKGKPIDTDVVMSWANGKVEAFSTRYPNAPALAHPNDMERVMTSELLETAVSLRTLMAADDMHFGEVMLQNEGKKIGSIDLESWKPGGAGQHEVDPVISLMEINTPLMSINSTAQSFGIDPASLMAEYDGEAGGFGLTLSSMSPTAFAVNPSMLDAVKVAGDLERTHITATFTQPDGKAEQVDTGNRPKGDAAKAMAKTLEGAVNKLLGRAEDAPPTVQSKVALTLFTADGMSPTRNYFANGEHVPRQMSLSREGDDLLVRFKNMEPPQEGSGTFDFTVRIRPDGSNNYEYLDVREKPVDKTSGSAVDRLARQLVMTWRNTADSDQRATIEKNFGKTYTEQLAQAKDILEASPKFLRSCQFKQPSADQLKKSDADLEGQMKEMFKAGFGKANHTGLTGEMVRCFNSSRFVVATTVQGQTVAVNAQMKDEHALDLKPGEHWSFIPPAKSTSAMIERIATFIPKTEPNWREMTHLLTQGMGLQGPMSQLGQEKFARLTGLPPIMDSMDPEGNKLMSANRMGRAAPIQDLSVDGDDYVLTQRYSYTPNSLMLGGTYQTGKMELVSPSLPSITFVTQMRVPRNQPLAPGEVPKFTYTTRIENANTL